MQRRMTGSAYRYRPYFWSSFIGTMLWVLPTLAIMASGGFLLARNYLGPRYLDESEVTYSRPQPIRILSPREAQAIARDEPSPVWTRGVQPSDIPKLEPQSAAQGDGTTRRRTRRRTTTQDAAPTPTAPVTVPAVPGATVTTPAPVGIKPPAPAPVAPAPAATGGGDAEPNIPQD